MNTLQEMLQTKMRHKEKVAWVTKKIKNSPTLAVQLVELLKTGTDIEKGTAAEIMKFVSQDQPQLLAPYLDTLIVYINYPIPRVKWGIPETIGNLACAYPQHVIKAIPKLVKNTSDPSIVVRWCAAFALCEIAKHNPETRKKLLPSFGNIIKKEKNNGVKNVYHKALKVIERTRQNIFK